MRPKVLESLLSPLSLSARLRRSRSQFRGRRTDPAAERLEDRTLLAGVAGWEQNLGGSQAQGLALDASGNSYVTGNLDVNGDGTRDVLAKYAADGSIAWSVSSAGTQAQPSLITRVALDSAGNAYLAGSFGSGLGTLTLGGVTVTGGGGTDAFVAKVDAAGSVVWLKAIGGTGDEAFRAIATDGSHLFVTGTLHGTSPLGSSTGGITDGVVAKLDMAGNLISSLVFGGPALDDSSDAIALDGAGGVYVCGRFQGAGAVFGGFTLSSIGENDGFVVRLDSALNVLWARQVGGDGEATEWATGFVVAPSSVAGELGPVYVTGQFSGTAVFGVESFTAADVQPDGFVTRLNPADGKFVWTKVLGGHDWQYGRCLAVDAVGDVYVAGSFNDLVDFDPGPNVRALDGGTGPMDAYVLKLGANGDYQAVWQIAGEQFTYASAIGVSADGSISVAGYTSGRAYFPTGGVFAATADSDGYLMRLDPSARLVLGTVFNDADGNGTQAASESGLAGRTVYIDANGNGGLDAGEASAVTDAAGRYMLVVAGDGTYIVRQVLPAGWSATTAAAVVVTFAGGTTTVSGVHFGSHANVVTKFLVVDDGPTDLLRRYAADGTDAYATGTVASPKDVASNADGSRYWVLSYGLSANNRVTVYDAAGTMLGSWRADGRETVWGSGLSDPQGITTNGTDIWIVDREQKRIYFYSGAAARLSDAAGPTDYFSLNKANSNATGITTDGTNLWVIDDGATSDKVYKYSLSGRLLGSWTVNYGGSTNASPTGITIDYQLPGVLWILDNASDRAYRFNSATGATKGTLTAASFLQLASGDLQGIADPVAGEQIQLAAAGSESPRLRPTLPEQASDAARLAIGEDDDELFLSALLDIADELIAA